MDGVKRLLGGAYRLTGLAALPKLLVSKGLLSEADFGVYLHVYLLLLTYRFQKCFFACSLRTGDLSRGEPERIQQQKGS